MTTGQVTFAVLALLVSVFFGGVAGATLKYFFDRLQNRVQPIAKRLVFNSLQLTPKHLPSKVQVDISVTDPSGLKVSVDRISLVQVSIENTSNRDFEMFNLIVSFPTDVFPLDEDILKPDPHFTVTTTSTPRIPKSFNEAYKWSDFSVEREYQKREYQIKPFNRRHTYMFGFTFASIKVTSGKVPDGAGGETPWVFFEPSQGEVKTRNFIVSAPMSGVELVESPREGRRNSLVVNMLGAILVSILTALLANSVVNGISLVRSSPTPILSIGILIASALTALAVFAAFLMTLPHQKS